MGKVINEILQIFNQKLNGGMVTIGNSCTVVGTANNKAREFIKPDGTYTSNWNEMGSSAILELPIGSTIYYAVLEWHSTISNNTTNGVIQEEYNPITFRTPTSTQTVGITQDSFNQADYMESENFIKSVKWANVTSLIKQSGNGEYTVIGIPTAPVGQSLAEMVDHDESPGWSLTVVYENKEKPYRNILLYMGIKHQDYFNQRIEKMVTLTGFEAPSIPKKTYLNIIAMGANPNMFSGVSIYENTTLIKNISLNYKLGNERSTTKTLDNNLHYAPNDNLFGGFIGNTDIENSSYGLINTKGTLGDKNNHLYDIYSQPSFRGNRTKTDIASFDISNKIKPNQDQLIVVSDLWSPNGDDSFQIISYGLQIDSEMPILTGDPPTIQVLKLINNEVIALNDEVEITITITNTAGQTATDLILKESLPVGSSLIEDSLSVNEAIIQGNVLPKKGINLGDLEVGDTIIVKYKLKFFENFKERDKQFRYSLNYKYLDSNDSLKEETLNGFATKELLVKRNPIERVDFYSNRTNASSKGEINYTLIIRNTGDTVATNIKLKNAIPEELEYVEGSLIFKDINLFGDLNLGVNLPNIFPQEEVKIRFKVRIK